MAGGYGEKLIKGVPIDEHLKSEQGRGLLRWIVKQEVKDDKFKGWTIGRNKYISEKLELYKEDVSLTEGNHKPSKEVTALEVVINTIKSMQETLKNHHSRISALETKGSYGKAEDFFQGDDE